jgi:succinate dehydrogenase/fumarate reductase flavoprotein subunit
MRALKLASGGIEVETDEAEGAAKFNAPPVVIADGGFQANLDMIRAHISSAPEKLLARNGGTATGDGLGMAQAVGAACFRQPRNGRRSYGRFFNRPAVMGNHRCGHVIC